MHILKVFTIKRIQKRGIQNTQVGILNTNE